MHSERKVKIGAVIDPEGLNYDQMGEIAIRYEELGFDTVTVFDHFQPIHSGPTAPYPECWSALEYIATKTQKIKIASFMTCASYRNPGLLAKVSTAVDQISRGRLVFGIGYGWYKADYEAYGFTHYEDRTKLLDEVLQIIKSLWKDRETSFEGNYFKLKKAANFPKPLQKPHPPIMIGSEMGGEKSLRLATEYADIVNVGWNMSIENLKAVMRRIDRLCSDAKRDRDSLTVSTNLDMICAVSNEELENRVRNAWPAFMKFESFQDFRLKMKNSLSGTPDFCLQKIEEISSLGVQEIFVRPLDLPHLNSVELFSEKVLPLLSH